MSRLVLRGGIPLLIVAIAFFAHRSSGQPKTAGPQYAAGGALIFPPDYREWTFLTSGLGMTYGPAGAADAAGNPNFDNVFADQASYASFLKTGIWPDKTVL